MDFARVGCSAAAVPTCLPAGLRVPECSAAALGSSVSVVKLTGLSMFPSGSVQLDLQLHTQLSLRSRLEAFRAR